MKALIIKLTVISLFVLCGHLYGQNLTIGAKGGFSIPNLSAGGSQNPLNSGYSSRFGADYGMYGEYHFSKLFSLTVGAEYSSQGGVKNKFQAYPTPPELSSVVSSPYLYANFKSEAKINYLLVPVMARFSWDIWKTCPAKFYVAAGPFAGFLLNAHQVTSGSSVVYLDAGMTTPLSPQPQSFDANTTIKNDLYKFNLGIDGVVGISYNLTPRHLAFIEGGANYGFLSIQKGSANGKNYTGAGVLTLGYAYTF